MLPGKEDEVIAIEGRYINYQVVAKIRSVSVIKVSVRTYSNAIQKKATLLLKIS